MKKLSTRDFVLLALLVAVLIVLGYVNIPQPAGLSITFNMIPVAIAAIVLGPLGGAIIGGAFGLISFLQCFGICGFSGMGAALVAINPFLTFVQRFFPRLIDGLLLGYIYRLLRPRTNVYVACAITGFFAAFLNTLLFMTSLVWLFGSTEYMQASMAGRGMLAYIVAAVGVNGLVEMLVSTVLTGAVGSALEKAGFFRRK
ncbi:MAG: ECF transporter S component [Clostridia bacterium]|nr:ECF transporter S component [Clostridia bacterium]MBQ8962820.1 ECF transporter S component [Clostridia bacterium]MBQ9040863.1 ECF transporter S component [Clostridia bacterium]